MAEYKVSDTNLTDVADAIRTKGGTSESMSFPDGFVSAIGNIPTGGGTTLITKSITANGTYNASSDNADGYSSVDVNVPIKCISGTFEGNTAGAAIDVNIPYTGNGYPIAGIIYPKDGGFSGDVAQIAQKYAAYMYAFCKMDMTETPTFSGNTTENKATITTAYKYSDSVPTTSTSAMSNDYQLYHDTNSSATSSNCVKMRSATKMSVFIASTSYGFLKDIEFEYQIIYSS